MNWYHWDTDIGQAVVCAVSVEEARTQVLATLMAEDAARDDLTQALSAEPNIPHQQPFAIKAWHP